MSRFVDRLLREGHISEPEFSSDLSEYARWPVFDVTNVARYLNEHRDFLSGDCRLDFPCAFPPYYRFFVEYREPAVELAGQNRYAVLVQVREGVPKLEKGTINFEREERVNAGWSFVCSAFAELGGDRVVLCPLALVFFVDEEGSVYSSSEGHFWVATGALHGHEDELEDRDRRLKLRTTLRAVMEPVLVAISLSNFRNVTSEKFEPDYGTVKKALKRYSIAPVTYHVLTIDASRTRKRYARATSAETDEARTNAAHSCRAHRKTYTSDAPLFGKYVGTWWWGPQLDRGDVKKGRVVHDYEVKK